MGGLGGVGQVGTVRLGKKGGWDSLGRVGWCDKPHVESEGECVGFFRTAGGYVPGGLKVGEDVGGAGRLDGICGRERLGGAGGVQLV